MTFVTSEMFDAVLETRITEPTPGFGAAAKVLKTNYDTLTSHRNLTTYSTSDIFHSCPRKFAIKKMQAATGTTERINSPTFAFGHAVGAGVAVYDETQNLRSAIWEAFRAWDLDLLESERKQGKRNGKSFWEAVWALYEYEQFYNEYGFADWESVKIEATVAIDFEDGHFYSGHIDEVLRHRETGRYRVKENKTTGFSNIDPALYSNSDQALSYAIVVDMLGGTEYDVLYTVYSATEQRWTSFEFVKQAYKKAEWIQDQLLMHQQIDGYQEVKFFPKRGRSCFNFMRRCEYYENCDLSFKHVFGMEYSELPAIRSLADIEAIEHIDFATTLTEIVSRQKEKLNEI
jgi:hypothetical protein